MKAVEILNRPGGFVYKIAKDKFPDRAEEVLSGAFSEEEVKEVTKELDRIADKKAEVPITDTMIQAQRTVRTVFPDGPEKICRPTNCKSMHVACHSFWVNQKTK